VALPFYIKKYLKAKEEEEELMKTLTTQAKQTKLLKKKTHYLLHYGGAAGCCCCWPRALQLTSVLLSPQHEFHLIIPKNCFSITSTTMVPSNCPHPCNKAFWSIGRW